MMSVNEAEVRANEERNVAAFRRAVTGLTNALAAQPEDSQMLSLRSEEAVIRLWAFSGKSDFDQAVHRLIASIGQNDVG